MWHVVSAFNIKYLIIFNTWAILAKKIQFWSLRDEIYMYKLYHLTSIDIQQF